MTVAELIHQLQQFRADTKVEVMIDGENEKLEIFKVVVLHDSEKSAVTIIAD